MSVSVARRDFYLKIIRYKRTHAKNRITNEMKGLIYQKYKKIVMPHGIHGKIQQSTQKRQKIVTFNQTDIIYHTVNVC